MKKGGGKISRKRAKSRFASKKCVHCGRVYAPTSGTQKYCGKCHFHCENCGKIVSVGQNRCCSCWQLGENNNSKKLETRKKIGKKSKGRSHPQSEETKRKISEANKGRLVGAKNPMFGRVLYNTGRCKWYTYVSKSAGKVRLQGTYELRFAKVLDKMDFDWKRPTGEYFLYDEGAHAYTPDFRIFDKRRRSYWYVDTKGWFSEMDQLKIRKVREENDITLLIVTKDLLEQFESCTKRKKRKRKRQNAVVSERRF